MTIEIDLPMLQDIHSPEDVKKLCVSDLPQLSAEVRNYLLESVSQSGGHLAAGLGTVELTVALHYVFNTPFDSLVWDVGHQCYPHKILTGRKEKLNTIRKKYGLSGFLKPSESPYDSFGAGHSSTSISAAVGMAMASSLLKENRKVVAIIGDGGMTAGLAYEALNHAGSMKDLDLIVILNDNAMSISPNVGALSSYLTRLLSGRVFNTARDTGKNLLRNVPNMRELARRTEKHVKGMVTPSTLFEELGFTYFGPVDGHDVTGLARILENLSRQTGLRFLHIVTQKGKGYQPAEADPVKYHGVGPFDLVNGINPQKKPNTPTYTEVFGQWLCDMATKDERLIGITPAMREGSGLVKFSKQFPKRYVDVGIAEQHSVTLAAGLAQGGMKPVVAIYSTFLQRAYDQFIHDVALQNLPVLFAIDRAGIVGPDGATHGGFFDLSHLRCIPNTVIMAPADENECRQMLYTGYKLNQPAVVRYPRGKGPGVAIETDMQELPLGKAEIRRTGRDIAFLSFGSLIDRVLAVGEELNATVVNMRFVKPLDTELLNSLARSHGLLVTIEDNVITGGAGSGVNEFFKQTRIATPIVNLGLPDQFLDHGERDEILAEAGLDCDGIKHAVQQAIQQQLNISPLISETKAQTVIDLASQKSATTSLRQS